MKINNIGNNEKMKVTAAIIGIDETVMKNTPIIVLKTDNGNYSNYKTVLMKQNLDLDSLQEGDLLDIEYKIYHAKNGVEFKNFTEVKKHT